MYKNYGVCIVFSSSYESDKARIVLSMADEGFGVLGVHEGINDVEYFYYDKAYDIEDMAKVVKPIVERYSQYIESVHYFTMETQNMKEYL
jgi:hypothetical protein